ncbi:hypothetical protein RCL1_002558 [Eukaryota sp. TZLM3-RCL]
MITTFGPSHLFISSSLVGFASGKQLYVYSLDDNLTLAFEQTFDSTIRFCGVFPSNKHFYIVTNNIYIYCTGSFAIAQQQLNMKRITACSPVSINNQDKLLFCDRNGDIFLGCNPPLFLFGHLLPCSSVLVSPCSKYILSSDRDHRIRRSLFPCTDVIQSFLFGHTDTITFTTFLSDPLSDATVYVSGGLDGVLNAFESTSQKSLETSITSLKLSEQSVRHFGLISCCRDIVVIAHCQSEIGEDSVFTLEAVKYDFQHKAFDSILKTDLLPGSIPTCGIYFEKSDSLLISLSSLQGRSLSFFTILKSLKSAPCLETSSDDVVIVKFIEKICSQEYFSENFLAPFQWYPELMSYDGNQN